MERSLRLLSLDKFVPGVLAAVGALLLVQWYGGSDVQGLEESLLRARTPLVRKAASRQAAPAVEPISKTGKLTRTGAEPADLPGSWPRFRGRNFDNVAADEAGLTRNWPRQGPKVLWSIPVGEGHAGAAIHKGRVYLLDYDRQNRRDAMRCLSLANGTELWRFSYPADVKFLYGMSRTVPAVTDKHLVGLGPKCHVICLDAMTGEFRWAYDLIAQFGSTEPPWYAGQCPLVDGGRAILAVGGDVLMMAVDCATGNIVWKTPNPQKWQMTHSSVVPMDFDGRRTYLYCASGGVVAVDAQDGSVVWKTEQWRVQFANVPSPVVLPGGRVFLSGGYGKTGCMMLQLKSENGNVAPHVLYRLKKSVFSAEQHTPIFLDGHIYGVIVKGEMACLDPAGTVAWTSGREKRFNRGPYLIADGLIFAMNDVGVLALVEVNPSGYRELARAKVLPARDRESWGPMAIAGGRLILRDLKNLTCLDVRGQ